MATLEARLLETTINRFAGSDTLVPYADKIAMPLSQSDMANAISLLTIHRRQLAGGAKRGGCLKRATEEETYYLLMKRIRQMEAANSRMAQRAAKAAALRSPNGNASETAVSDWPPLVCPS